MLNLASLERLDANLQTLKSCRNDHIQPLVSYWGNYLVDPVSLWGRVWRWMNPSIAEDPDDLKELLNAAAEAFKSLQKTAKASEEICQKLISERSWSIENKKLLFDEAGKLYLIERIEKNAQDILKNQPYIFFAGDGIQQVRSKSAMPFFLKDLALTGWALFPLSILEDLVQKRYISDESIACLKTWFTEKPSAFESLYSFVEEREKEDPEVWKKVSRFLRKHTPEVLLIEEEASIYVRTTIQDRGGIQFKGQWLRLKGSPIESRPHCTRYLVEGRSDVILAVARNRIYWKAYLAAIEDEGASYALYASKISIGDEYAALVEKVDTRAFCQPFASALEGIHIRRPLVDFVSSCIREGTTPLYLSLKHIGLHVRGSLGSTKVLEKGLFNPISLEQLLFEASLNNPSLYMGMIEASGLLKTKEAVFLREAIASPHKEIQHFDRGIQHQDVLEKARMLQAQVKGHLLNEPKNKQKDVLENILRDYDSKRCFGRLFL